MVGVGPRSLLHIIRKHRGAYTSAQTFDKRDNFLAAFNVPSVILSPNLSQHSQGFPQPQPKKRFLTKSDEGATACGSQPYPLVSNHTDPNPGGERAHLNLIY